MASAGLGDLSHEDGYRSPAGTWEPIRKSVLEDFTLSNAAFRLMAYLATKPASWVINEEHLALATGWPCNRIRQALRDLRKRGLLDEAVERKPSGTIVRREWSLRRDLVVAGHDLDEGNLDASKPDSSHDQGEREKPQVGTPMHSSLPQAQLGASKSPAIEKTESFREDGVFSEDGVKDPSSEQSPDPGPDAPGTRPEIERICEDLAGRVETLTGRRPPVTMTGWRRPARFMLDIDGLSEDQIRAAIKFAAEDEFWAPNIRSISKLRDKLPQLRAAAVRKTRPARSGRLENAAEVARRNRVNDQPSAAMKAFGRLAGMEEPKPSDEESRREITS